MTHFPGCFQFENPDRCDSLSSSLSSLATPRTRTFSTFHIHQNESRGVKKPPGSVFGQGNRRESRFINVGVNSARTGRGRP